MAFRPLLAYQPNNKNNKDWFLTTNLPTQISIEGMSKRDIMIATGQIQPDAEAPLLPTLRVNYDDEDNEGNKTPRGEWVVLGTDGVKVYAPVVLLRPLKHIYQYSHFDNTKMKLISKSVFFSSWGEEIPDTAGGFKCGKLTRAQQEGLTPEELSYQKQIKLSHVIFGLVSMEGKTADGKDVTLKEVPALFYAKGTNYMPMDDFLQMLGRTNKLMQGVVIKMDLDRKKPDGVVFWVARLSIHEEVPVDAKSIAMLNDIAALINQENETVVEKWTKARSKGQRDPKDAKLIEHVQNAAPAGKDDLESDFGPDTLISAG